MTPTMSPVSSPTRLPTMYYAPTRLPTTYSAVSYPTFYPSSLPGDSNPGSSTSSSSSSSGSSVDPVTISMVVIGVSMFVFVLCIIATRCCCRSPSEVYTSPSAAAVLYNQTQHQATPTTVAVISSAPSAPPMAQVYTDSSKVATATAVVAFADTSSSGGAGIELQPVVASAPPVPTGYYAAASVPYTTNMTPNTTVAAVGPRPAMPTTGPITTYNQPQYVCTVTYV